MTKTKWIPLVSYEYAGTVRVILGRRNKKTGMLYFKTKRINGLMTNCYSNPSLNIDDQFKCILEGE